MFLSCFIFWGRRSFFLLSVTFVRTKTTGVDFTLYPVLYEKEMAFICVLIILGDPGAACLHYEQSLFSSKIRGEERRTRAARSVGVEQCSHDHSRAPTLVLRLSHYSQATASRVDAIQYITYFILFGVLYIVHRHCSK